MTLVASRALFVLEAFRVPYVVVPRTGASRAACIVSSTGAEMRWIRPSPSASRAWHRIAKMPIFGALASDDDLLRELGRTDRDWYEAEVVSDATGSAVGHVWRAPDGSALLPFDPNELVASLLREEYARPAVGASLARSVYYRVRPLIPRLLQMAARRRFASIQGRASFPGWPIETALHDFYRYLLGLVEDVYGAPLPWVAPWPAPYRWSVVLTHDVEKTPGYRHVEALVELERQAGVRSAWYFVPERDYAVEDELLRTLARDGFEIGVHGLRHDGRDLSPGVFEERLPAMRGYAERWGAVGFRAPATQRSWDRVGRLGFDHDSSYSDVARYEPQSGGSCSWHPFFVGDVVELPITLPMDHTIFELLGRDDAGVWFEKVELLRDRGGMGLLLTHPDYLLDPHRLGEYERFVRHVAKDDEAWLALPREVSAWWRRRAASFLELRGAAWRVVGPAAVDARVVLGASGA